VTETANMITMPSGEHAQCGSFEAQLHDFKSSSIECTRSLDHERYVDQPVLMLCSVFPLCR
jgi:hypothetical protein